MVKVHNCPTSDQLYYGSENIYNPEKHSDTFHQLFCSEIFLTLNPKLKKVELKYMNIYTENILVEDTSLDNPNSPLKSQTGKGAPVDPRPSER